MSKIASPTVNSGENPTALDHIRPALYGTSPIGSTDPIAAAGLLNAVSASMVGREVHSPTDWTPPATNAAAGEDERGDATTAADGGG